MCYAYSIMLQPSANVNIPPLPVGFSRKLVRVDGLWWLIYVKASLHRFRVGRA